MPLKANVKIEYGPYKSNGIADYREDRLIGLKSKIKLKMTKVKIKLKII